MVSKVMFSSEETRYGTPIDLFRKIDEIFQFNLDVCAEDWNAKVDNFISPEMDGLITPWTVAGVPARAWMNPPYGKREKACPVPYIKCKKKKCRTRGFHIDKDLPGIEDWVHRAVHQSSENGTLVSMLAPARTDTDWFQTIWYRARLICFFRHRIKFDSPPGVDRKNTAVFPSVVAVFSEDELQDEHYEGMSEFGNVIDPRQGQIITYGVGFQK
jgi:site-specific DNA-methyltransferase (adenine-specific)